MSLSTPKLDSNLLTSPVEMIFLSSASMTATNSSVILFVVVGSQSLVSHCSFDIGLSNSLWSARNCVLHDKVHFMSGAGHPRVLLLSGFNFLFPWITEQDWKWVCHVRSALVFESLKFYKKLIIFRKVFALVNVL